MNDNNEILGQFGNYASADFPDAEMSRPLEIENYSYSNAISNAVSKHYSELKEKSSESVELIWKKKIREFLLLKNDKLVEYLTIKIKNHPVLGKAENFFQLFGKQSINCNNNTIHEIRFDISGAETSNEVVDNACKEKGFQSLESYMKQTQFLFDLYKETGENILNEELRLSIKLEHFDSIQSSLKVLNNLKPNDSFEAMMSSVQNYLETLFNENNFEENYKTIIELYRKFIGLRDIVQVVRKRESMESEPLCSICFTDKISYAFVPCGHTFCPNCVKRQALQCSICRSQIKERLKIYFS